MNWFLRCTVRYLFSISSVVPNLIALPHFYLRVCLLCPMGEALLKFSSPLQQPQPQRNERGGEEKIVPFAHLCVRPHIYGRNVRTQNTAIREENFFWAYLSLRIFFPRSDGYFEYFYFPYCCDLSGSKRGMNPFSVNEFAARRKRREAMTTIMMTSGGGGFDNFPKIKI